MYDFIPIVIFLFFWIFVFLALATIKYGVTTLVPKKVLFPLTKFLSLYLCVTAVKATLLLPVASFPIFTSPWAAVLRSYSNKSSFQTESYERSPFGFGSWTNISHFEESNEQSICLALCWPVIVPPAPTNLEYNLFILATCPSPVVAEAIFSWYIRSSPSVALPASRVA